MALSGATIPGQSGPGSNGNEGVFRIPQSSSITGTSPSDCLMSYPVHSLGWDLTPQQRCSRCKNYLISVGNIAMWINRFLAGSKTTSQLLKKQRQKKALKGFLRWSCDSLRAPNGHTNYQREIIIYCIPTPL